MGEAMGHGWMRSTFLMVVLASIAFWCVVEAVPILQTRPASEPASVIVYTVQPGDTLWKYASGITHEGGNVGDAVDELMRLNDLDTASLHAGQRLIVPDEA